MAKSKVIERPVIDGEPKTVVTTQFYPSGHLPAKVSVDDIKTHLTDIDMVFKNYPIPGGETSFPDEPHLRTCDRYYPASKFGPVFLDEPFFDDELEDCKRKADVIRKSGVKYIILSKDCDLQSAMEQIGAV